ncbi:hypothetical protein LINPERHAP1_LOCUS14068 [Linum perenne]
MRLQGFFNPSTRVGQWAKLNYHVSGFESLFTYLVYALDLSQRLFSSTQTKKTKGLRAKLNSTEILTECRNERPGGGTGPDGVLEEDCRHDLATEDLPDEDRIPIGGRYAYHDSEVAGIPKRFCPGVSRQIDSSGVSIFR